MIRICRLGKTRMSLRGHANSADYGQDLVCAAASALAMTLGENLKQMEQPEICLQSGDTELSCVSTLEAEQVFDCIWKGFQLLAEIYPDHIRIDAC